MAVQQIIESVYATLSPLCVEILFMMCFAAGFVFLRLDVLLQGNNKKKQGKPKSCEGPEAPAAAGPFQKLKAAVEANQGASAVLAAWRQDCDVAPTPPALFRAVLQALGEAEASNLVPALVEHVRRHRVALGTSRIALVVLDSIARLGQVGSMEALAEEFHQNLKVEPTLATFEVLLGGYAAAGDKQKVEEVMARMRSSNLRCSVKALSLVIKGFLKNGMIDAVVEKVADMKGLGFEVPPFATTQLIRLACEAGRGEEIFAAVEDEFVWNSEAPALLLEACQKSKNIKFAKQLEQNLREKGVAFSGGVFDALLKAYAVTGDTKAHELFKEMLASGVRVGDGLCVGLIARCAEAKFLRFAEEVMQYTRQQGTTTLAVHSAMMKVYAFCGMYDKACDVYQDILDDGLEPDAVMYGCLMKFAVECGRTELSWKISQVAPQLDIQNYMSLIRAAGRDRNVERAFELLERLKATGATLDVAVYNCVLSACVSAGALDRARELMEEMRGHAGLDVVSFNTLLNGYCQAGKISCARALLEEMTSQGLQPNDVSYNCLVHAALSAGPGGFRDAWATIDLMERNGVKVDHYTISIMMKALKTMRQPQDNVAKTLALLDRHEINVCSDEILLISVLEVCIRHDQHRLEGILDSFSKSGMRPSVPAYGSLIKACSVLKRLPACWGFFKELVQRGLVPTEIVLGCMLDALVCNGETEQAVELLAQWKGRIKPNTVIYSIIIKGFANTQQPHRALDMWREMREEGVQANAVVYNAIIDAQARCGSMEPVPELLESMQADGVRPDAITYCTIMKGYCIKGDLTQAMEVFRDMQKAHLVKDSVVYNTLLDGCTRHSQYELADRLLDEMLESSTIIPSGFTLGILVKMYGKRRQLGKAFEVLETMRKRFNLKPNPQVRMCLLCVCVNNNAMDKAQEVFNDMACIPGGIDAKAYGTMISGCMRAGKLERAASLVEEAFGLAGAGERKMARGQTIDPDTLERLMQAIGHRGLSQKVGVPLMDKLKAAKIPLSGRLCTSVVSSAVRAEQRGPGGGRW